MGTISDNSTVTIIYEGKLDNGEIFKVITEDQPLKIQIGNSEVPPTLEKSLLGMSAGQSKTVRITPEETYGPRQKVLLQTVKKSNLGENISPKPGMILSLKVQKEGVEHQIPATVMELKQETVVVDYNHPLAGHHLTFNVTILKVENI